MKWQGYFIKERIAIILLVGILSFTGCSSGLSGKYVCEAGEVLEFQSSTVFSSYSKELGSFSGTYKKTKGGYELSVMGGLVVVFAEKKGKNLVIQDTKYVRQKK
jgi:hypothetical protein